MITVVTEQQVLGMRNLMTSLSVVVFALLAGCASYNDISSDKSPRNTAPYATTKSFASDAAASTWPDEQWWKE